MCRPHSLPRKARGEPSAVPSRHVIVCHASAGRLRASAFAEIG
jgi:hypothetical protein